MNILEESMIRNISRKFHSQQECLNTELGAATGEEIASALSPH